MKEVAQGAGLIKGLCSQDSILCFNDTSDLYPCFSFDSPTQSDACNFELLINALMFYN